MNTLEYINYNENNKQNLRLGSIESRRDVLIETYKEDFSTTKYIDVENSSIIIDKLGATTKSNKTKVIDFIDNKYMDIDNSVNVENVDGHIKLKSNQLWGKYVTNTIKTRGTKYIELNAEDKTFDENAFNLTHDIKCEEGYKSEGIAHKKYFYVGKYKDTNLIINKLNKEYNIEKELTVTLKKPCQNISIKSNDEYITVCTCEIGYSYGGGSWFVYEILLINSDTLELLDTKYYSTDDEFIISMGSIWHNIIGNLVFISSYDSVDKKNIRIYNIERNKDGNMELIELKKNRNIEYDILDVKLLNETLDIGTLYKDKFQVVNDSKKIDISIENPLKIYILNGVTYIVSYSNDEIILNQMYITNDKIEISNKQKFKAPNIQDKDSFNIVILKNNIYMFYTVPQQNINKKRTCTLILDTNTNNDYFKINYKEYIDGNISMTFIDNKLFLIQSNTNSKIYESQNNKNNIKYFISNDDGYTYHQIELGKQFEFPKLDHDIKIKIELSNFETISPYVTKLMLTQWNDEKESKTYESIFVSKILPFYSRNKIGILTADVVANGASISWFISDNGGNDYREIQLGIPFDLHQEFSTELKIKFIVKNDIINSEVPVIKSYTLRTTAFVFQSQIETMQINLMKTNFKIDSYSNAASNNLKNMFIDVFINENNINKKMSNCSFDPSNKSFSGSVVVSNPIIIGKMKSRIMLTTDEELGKGSIEYYISGDSKTWYSIQKDIPKSLNEILRRNFVMIKAVMNNNAKLNAWGLSWD